MATHSLYALLGLPEDTDTLRLRAAYEGAVGSAARRQDWHRARELSQSFDRLPAGVRLAVYSGGDRKACLWEPDTQIGRRPKTRSTAHSADPLRWRVVFGTVLAISLAALAGLGAWTKYVDANRTAAPLSALTHAPLGIVPGSTHSVAARPAQTTPRPNSYIIRPPGDIRLGNTGEQIGGLPLWTTPPGIPLDARGRATMRCAGVWGTSKWSKIGHLIAFTCPVGQAPEYRAAR